MCYFFPYFSILALGGFNQLVKKVQSLKKSNDENAEMEALLVENYIDNHPSQLTGQGQSDVTSAMKDGEVALLFYDGLLKITYKVLLFYFLKNFSLL